MTNLLALTQVGFLDLYSSCQNSDQEQKWEKLRPQAAREEVSWRVEGLPFCEALRNSAA